QAQSRRSTLALEHCLHISGFQDHHIRTIELLSLHPPNPSSLPKAGRRANVSLGVASVTVSRSGHTVALMRPRQGLALRHRKSDGDLRPCVFLRDNLLTIWWLNFWGCEFTRLHARCLPRASEVDDRTRCWVAPLTRRRRARVWTPEWL